MNISMYKNSTDTKGAVAPMDKVLGGIKDGKWKAQIEALREMDEETYSLSKRNLPCVTFAGTFTERKDECLDKYSGFIILDIDGLDDAQVRDYKKGFAGDGYVYACFISPSGAGLKILVKLDIEPIYHTQAFVSLEQYFKNVYAVALDKSGKNISRLCYVSYDAEAIINKDSKVYTFSINQIAKTTSAAIDNRPDRFKGYVISKEAKYSFGVCEEWTKRTHQYVEGDRNNFIHLLGCNLNRVGVDINDAIVITYNNYSELSFNETESCIISAYKNKKDNNTHDVYDISKKLENKEDIIIPSEKLTTEEDLLYSDTWELLSKGIKKNMVVKLVKAYGSQVLKLDEERIKEVALLASSDFHDKKSKSAIPVFDITESINAFLESGIKSGGISTCIPEFDDAIGGGIPAGSFMGLIADGGCYKSIYAQCIASKAMEQNKAVLYLCGEMSIQQMMVRVIEKELSLRDIKDVTPEMIQALKEKVKDNFFLTTSTDWTKEGILDIVKNIKDKTGKDVELICIDGITQMCDTQKNEILSAISNAEVCKKISKEANDGRGCVVIALVHVSGTLGKHFRNTFQFVRGAKKMLNNMDSYICHSLLIDEMSSDFDNGDIFYKQNIFYLRLVDKRNSGSIISKIIQVNRPLSLEILSVDPAMMEVKTN